MTRKLDINMLEDLAPATKGAISSTDANKLVQLDADGKIAGAYLEAAGGMSLVDGRHLALEIADLKGVAFNYGAGQADPFDSDTIGATSTNETYDASNDWYYNAAIAAEGTFGLTGGTDYAAWGDGPGNGKHVAHQDTAGNTGALSSVKINVDSVSTSFDAQCSIYTNNSGSPGTIVGGASDTVSIAATGDKTFTWSSNAPSLTAGTSYWFVFSDISGGSGSVTIDYAAYDSSHATGNHDTITSITQVTSATARVAFAVGATSQNMTLINAGLTAATAPSKGLISIQAQFVDSSTLNTDMTAEISRDGGTTWTAVTLAAGATNANFTMYSGEATISAQPSGTSMKYRVKTLNNKNIRVSGVVLRWS